MELTINEARTALHAAETAWFKSSYSNDTGGSCVEIAELPAHVGIRDSKDTARPAFMVSRRAWNSFVAGVLRSGGTR